MVSATSGESLSHRRVRRLLREMEMLQQSIGEVVVEGEIPIVRRVDLHHAELSARELLGQSKQKKPTRQKKRRPSKRASKRTSESRDDGGDEKTYGE